MAAILSQPQCVNNLALNVVWYMSLHVAGDGFFPSPSAGPVILYCWTDPNKDITLLYGESEIFIRMMVHSQ